MKYIDLGLPSETLWADENVEGFYTFNQAVAKYGCSLPTKEQWEELKNLCQWEWLGDGYKITGPNGNTIVLPAEYCRYYDGRIPCLGYLGCYWSSTPYDYSEGKWSLRFYPDSVKMVIDSPCKGRLVRFAK